MGDYVSVDEVKSHSKITYEDLGYTDEGSFNGFLDGLIAQAEAIVDDYCGVPSSFFKAGGLTFTELCDYDEEFIALNHYPILEVVSVAVNTASYGEAEVWVTLDSTDYILYPDEGLIKLVSGKKPTIKEKSVKVTYKAGYVAVPEAIKFACIQLCSNYLHAVLQRKVSPLVRIDEFAVKLVIPEVFTPELKKMLLPYTRQGVSVG